MNYILPLLTLFFSLITCVTLAQQNIDKAEVDAFVSRHASIYKMEEAEIHAILSKAELKPDIIEKMSKPAEKKMTWERYRKIFMTTERTSAGVAFWNAHEAALQTVSSETGVPIEIICGIIGVETFFGKIKGSYQVLDALYTLSFAYPKRAKYFQSELDEFLILAREERISIDDTKGSYAGAMGYCQFMPSSYRAYAKSFDEGGTRDLINSPEDAIASVANYLKVHRWQPGEPVAVAVKMASDAVNLEKQPLKPQKLVSQYKAFGYDPVESIPSNTKATLLQMEMEDGSFEYWMGFENFSVITRYNHSPLYALAVYQLAQAIKEKRDEL